METILLLIIVFPLAGGFFHALLGRTAPRRLIELVACLAIVASFAAAVAGFVTAWGRSYTFTFFTWFHVGSFKASFDVYYDSLAAVMTLMVTFVSSLIHIYSASFMREDEDYARYFCYLNLFVFSMLVITLSDNILFLFLGWEGVGFCSYALIGFWYSDVANATAGRKAFLLTRIGDVAFGIVIGLFFVLFDNFSISYANAHASQLTTGMATLVGLLLLWSAVGKSAQLPLVVWLPDAMAGPTPVSALIHAATMVTAGVYLLMRLFPIVAMSHVTLVIITIVAAITAFYAACSALAQKDIKRVLAYSTISQVGYMFLGVGAGDIIGGMFHLLSHAFFKSLLFLTAGCIIQALDEEHDIFRMGQYVRRHLPAVSWFFLAGAMGLGAVPPSSGYFSKGRVLLATFNHPELIYKIMWGVGTATAFLTTLYTFRLFFLVFSGEPHEGPVKDVKSIPGLMPWITLPLAFLALFAGFMNFPTIWHGGAWLAQFLASIPGGVPDLHAPALMEWKISILDAVLSLVALILAYLLYGPKDMAGFRKPVALGEQLHDFLFSGFYLDRLYYSVLVRPYEALAKILWEDVDESGIDNGVVGTSRIFPLVSTGIRLWTTGRLSTYLSMLFLGLTVILAILVLSFS